MTASEADDAGRNAAARTERAQLAEALLRLNPWGGYCVKPCKHPGHTNAKYRETLRRYGVSVR